MNKHRITVKSYMLNTATPDFTFMEVWNNNIPMPSIIMEGTFEKETKGMIFANLTDELGNMWKGWVIKSAILDDKIIGETISDSFVIKVEINKSTNIVGNFSIYLSFPYNEEVINKVKSNFNQRYYHSDTKEWEISFSYKDMLESVFSDYVLEINDLSGNLFCENNKVEIEYKTIPFKHQEEAVKYGMTHDKWLLADEMGLGKTKIAIDIAVNRKKMDNIKHCLIICGVNGLKWNWKEEIEKHSNEKCYVLGQDYGNRVTNFDKLHELEELDKLDSFFIVTNIETLRFNRKTGKKIRRGNKLKEERVFMITDKLIDLLSRDEIGMIVFDEAHKAKDSESMQGEQFLRLHTPIEIAMTGTPLMNSPLDLYMIFKWLGYENHSLYAFKNHYCELGGYGGYQVIGFKNQEELHSRLNEISLRRLKKDVLDLPEKIDITEYVEMGSEQTKIYKEVQQEILDDMEHNIDKYILSPDPLSQLIRLRQATGYTGILSTKIMESAKFDRALELIEDAISNNQKVIVFSNWLLVIKPFIDILQNKYGKVAIIQGEIKGEEKMEQIRMFQEDDKCKVAIGTTSAMGTGFTLTAATVEIFLDEPWNYASKSQAIDRAHRVGTKDNLTIYTLICKNTIDERINNIVKYKKSLSDEIVDGKTGKLINQVPETIKNKMDNILNDNMNLFNYLIK